MKKALIASLKMFYERILVPNAKGDVKHIPMLLGSSKDRQWHKDNFHKEYACGIDKYTEGMTKPLPRGTIQYNVFQVDLQEYLNDNVRVESVEAQELSKDKKKYFRVRFVPVTIPLTLIIQVENQNEKFWVSEALLEFLEKKLSVVISHNNVEDIPVEIIPELGANASSRDAIDMSSSKENMKIEMKFTVKFSYPKLLGNEYKNQIESSKVNTSPK